MPGMPLRDLLLGDVPYDLNAIMHEVGMTLSSIASHSFLETGFLDKALRVMPYPCTDVLKCAKNCLSHETVLSVLTADSILAISTILEQHSYLWSRSSQGFYLEGQHLVHGDFDPANILVNKVKDVWKVSAILDWEFAFSGSYLWDIASMLRYAHKMPPVFQTSFINALKKSGIDLPDTWSSTIHLLNLCSLLDCLKRSDFKHHPHRCFDIRELITFIVLELKSHE